MKKIETTLPLKVKGQACTNNCEEKIWAGKLESSMVIQKAVSTMTPLTLLRVLPGGNT